MIAGIFVATLPKHLIACRWRMRGLFVHSIVVRMWDNRLDAGRRWSDSR
jgi:hypothetical protein